MGLAFLLLGAPALRAETGPVSEVRIDAKAGGYEIRLGFLSPLRYQQHTPRIASWVLHVQLTPADIPALNRAALAQLAERADLAWDSPTGVPLLSLVYEGEDPLHPVITCLFTTEVEREVRSSADGRSLLITIRPMHPVFHALALAVSDRPARRGPDPATLIAQAERALAARRSRQAIKLATAAMHAAQGDLQQQAWTVLARAVEQDMQQDAARRAASAASRIANAKPPRAAPARRLPDAKPLMANAERALAKRQFRRAVELATDAVKYAPEPLQPDAQALLARAVEQDVLQDVTRRVPRATASSGWSSATPEPAGRGSVPAEPAPVSDAQAPVPIVPTGDFATLMQEADAAMTQGDFARAAAMYAAVSNAPDRELGRKANERLGLAYDRSGQPDRAKAVYQASLREFPSGPDADRVRQRLAGLVTATQEPKPSKGRAPIARAAGAGPWETRYFGTVAEQYSWDETRANRIGSRVNRSDFLTDTDLHARWRNEGYEISSQFSGSHRETLLSSRRDEDRITTAAVELRDLTRHWTTKMGRQSQTSGGVLGRFDGVRASYSVTPLLTFNGVFGSPVESPRDTTVDTNRTLYDVSVDLGPWKDRWELSPFFITQRNQGLVDRRAIGSELRYFDKTRSLFWLTDYDLFFSALNAMILNGQWTLPTRTTLHAGWEYRRLPTLTLNNAIQGQQVNELSDLFARFSNDQLATLAKERTAVSTSMTFSIAQQLSVDVQLIGEAFLSELEGTPASGGVEAVPGTGWESFYSTQLVVTNWWLQNDVLIAELRFADTQQYRRYAINLNHRLPLSRALRMTPEFLFEMRTGKGNGSDRVTYRPKLSIEYLLRKWLRLELEGGIEWRDQETLGVDDNSKEFFVTGSSRLVF